MNVWFPVPRGPGGWIAAVLLAAGWACGQVAASAQTGVENVSTRTGVEAGAGFHLGLPQDAFDRNVESTGVGLGGFAAVRPGGGPFLLGADLGFVNYGRTRRQSPMAGVPEIMLEVRTHNNILMGHPFLRLQQREGTLRPFADVLFGFKYLFTESRVRGVDSDPGDDFARTVNLDDWATSYGVGGGLDVSLVTRPMEGERHRAWRLRLHLGARYLAGGEAEYLREDSITRVDGDEIRYDLRRSRTNLLQPLLGLTLEF